MGRPPWDTFLRQDRQWLFQGTDRGASWAEGPGGQGLGRVGSRKEAPSRVSAKAARAW